MFKAGNLFFSGMVICFAMIFFVRTPSYAQCRSGKEIWSNILTIENDTISTVNEKLKRAYNLKNEFEKCGFPQDSIYARLLHRIAALLYVGNDYVATKESVDYVLESIHINTSGNKSASQGYVINSYYNAATFYRTLNLNSKALAYYDSVILLNKRIETYNENAINSRVFRADIFFKNGDFQKCIDECTSAMSEAKKAGKINAVMESFNRRAQSYAYLGFMDHAFSDADSAEKYAQGLHVDFEMANALKIKAQIQVSRREYDEADKLFTQAIITRLKTKDNNQIADDYTDLGNYYLQKKKDYRQAENCYFHTIEYAKKSNNPERLCKGYINLGELSSQSAPGKQYAVSEMYYRQALKVYGISYTSFLQNPALDKLSSIGNIDLVLIILNNKTELLLNTYKLNHRKEYIEACLETALLMDSAVTQARRQQTGEQSKLYWRNNTRSFFINALEACYLANDMEKAFYFMEKSRAVLLNDKLNELSASLYLPEAEARIEQDYKLHVLSAQRQLGNSSVNTAEYQKYQLELLQSKDMFERYIKTLEQKYPVYYQYKYSDNIPSLSSIQTYLSDSAGFVHYFFQDTTAYILCITTTKVQMIKLDKSSFDVSELDTFMNWCSNKQQLNNHYSSFIALSHKLYNNFFRPLHLSPGRVILCQDNFLLPFEALCSDDGNKKFLIQDYIFNYVYSACFLMKKFKEYPSHGNFIGFAPVSFQKYLLVPDLKNSAKSLEEAALNYNEAILFKNEAATRNNFISRMAGYRIVNVFSHAMADTAKTEPMLYMQDSTINLSELQMLDRPATQLIMLSACQTNVGKNATGEGIYSLARGFSSAGIPAVAATLWKADEDAIYTISRKFHEYISGGMRKDEALQKAKLYFMQQDRESMLPYYWANMVLIGNGDPVNLEKQNYPFKWRIPVMAIILFAGLIIAGRIFFNKAKSKPNFNN